MNDKVLFSLNSIDMQCAHNRSGLYSVDSVRRVMVWNWALFSAENNNLALLVPFALMEVQ